MVIFTNFPSKNTIILNENLPKMTIALCDQNVSNGVLVKSAVLYPPIPCFLIMLFLTTIWIIKHHFHTNLEIA